MQEKPSTESTLPASVQAAYERLLATPPALTADLSWTVGELREAVRDERLCASGVRTGLAAVGRRTARHDCRVTAVEALDAGVSVADVLSALKLRPEADAVLRLFAVDCAEMVLPLYVAEHPDDQRPKKAIEAARGYALGVITAEELAAAWVAARVAARDAAWDAAWDAARVAAGDAAGDAAWDATWVAAWDATWVACGQLLRRYHAEAVTA